MVQAEAIGKTCFDIGEAQPIDAERAGRGEYDTNHVKELSCRWRRPANIIYAKPTVLFLSPLNSFGRENKKNFTRRTEKIQKN